MKIRLLGLMCLALVACRDEARFSSSSGSGEDGGSEDDGDTGAAESTGAPLPDLPADECGDGTVKPGQLCFRTETYELPGHECELLEVLDQDGDGADDLVTLTARGFIAVEDGGFIDVFLGGQEQLRYMSTWLVDSVTRVTAADMDADGRDDVILATESTVWSGDVGSPAYWTTGLRAVDDGGWIEVQSADWIHEDPYPRGGHEQTLLPDTNGPGRMLRTMGEWADIVSWDETVPALTPATTPAPWMLADYARDVATIDLGPDEHRDVLVAVEDGLEVLKGQADGAFAAQAELIGPADVRQMRVRDVNGDGREDVLAVRYDEPAVDVLLAPGDGTLSLADTIPIEPFDLGPRPMVDAGDLDGDGLADVAVASEDELIVLRGDGEGRFTDPLVLVGGEVRAVVTADLDADGFTDLALCVSGETLAVLYSDP